MKKMASLIIIIDFFTVILMSILVFHFWFNESLAFWIGYIALVMALILQILPVLLTSNQNVDRIHTIFLYTISIIYLCIQICISVVGGFLQLLGGNAGIAAISIAALLLYIIFCVIYGMVSATGKGSYALEDKKYLEMLAVRLEALKEGVFDEEILSDLENAIEKIRYSDVAHSAYITDIEQRINKVVDTLCNYMQEEKYDRCRVEFKKLNEFLAERAALCKVL